MKTIRRLVGALLLSFVLWAQPAAASWTLVTHAVSGNADGGAGPFRAPHTGTVNATGADLYLCAVSHYNAAQQLASTLTDVSGNSYTLLADQTAAGDANNRVSWYYKVSPAVSSVEAWTVTQDVSNLPTNAGVACLAFSGTAASPTITHTESGTTSSTPSAGSLGANGNLVVTAVADYAATVSSIDSSFALVDTSAYTGSNNMGIATAWQNASAGVSGAVNPTFTMSATPTANATQAVSFTGAGGGGATSHPCAALTLLGVGC